MKGKRNAVAGAVLIIAAVPALIFGIFLSGGVGLMRGSGVLRILFVAVPLCILVGQ